MTTNPLNFDRELEKQLWQAMKEAPNNDKLFADLVEFYLPLVNKIVRQVAFRVNWRVEPRDLLGSGVIGLQKAITRYTDNRNIPFERYASTRIRGEMLDELRTRDPLTRSQRQNVRQVYHAINEFISKHERIPSNQEIATEIGMSLKDVSLSLEIGCDPINLEAEYDDGLHYMDIIPDRRVATPEQIAGKRMAMTELRNSIKHLDKRDQQLLYFRHQKGMSVQEVAASLNISQGRVSQLYNEIVIKLRTFMKVQVMF